MKVVILQDDFPPESKGGAGNIAMQLAVALYKKGNEVQIIASTQNKNSAGKGEFQGMPVYRMYSDYHERWRAWRSLYNTDTVREVRRLLKEIKPDIVHAHNVHQYLSYASLTTAKRAGAKVFLTAHDLMLMRYGKLPPDGKASAWRDLRTQKWRYNPLRNYFIRKALQNVQKVFAVSDALRQELERSGIGRIVTVHNGIDVALWDPPSPSVAEFAAQKNLLGKKVILFGGRIGKAKGGDAILAALPSILKSCPEAVLAIAGTASSYIENLQLYMQSAGFANAIKPLGWLSGEQLQSAYRLATVVIVPSLYLDPLPTVVLEAMASQKPVVASNRGGSLEMVIDGETGFIVDPNNTELLAARITELLTDESKALAMGRAGFERVQKEFSFEKQVEQTLFWYAQ